MIANFVEFRRSSTKFYVNLRNFGGLYCFTINEISCRCAKFHLANSLKVAEFVRNLVSGSEILFEISRVGAKFQTKFRKWVQNFKRNFQHFVCVSEISKENPIWRSKFRSSFVVITRGSQNAECKLRGKKKQFTDGSLC